MGKRSHDALRARDRGRAGIPLNDSPTDHGLGGPRPRPPTTATLTAWLRRAHATLESPTPARPYWTVRQAGRYLAAGRTAHRAIEHAMSSRFLTPLRRSETKPQANRPLAPPFPDRSRI